MPKITKSQIIYDEADWLAGLHPQNGSRTIPQKFGKFAAQEYSFNPFINLGYASNGYLNTSITNNSVIKTRLVAKTQDDNDSDFYALEDRNLLHRIDNYNTAANNDYFPHEIVSAAGNAPTRKCFDICKYVIGTTVHYFYSYRGQSGGAADIGRFTPDSTFDDDYMSTIPTGAAYVAFSHLTGDRSYCPLIVGHDDVLYAGGQNYVAAYDGPTDTLTPQALTLETRYNIVDFAKYPSRSLVIFAQGDGNCRAYFWDYLSNDPYDIKDIGDFDIMGAFEYKGTVGCVTRGRDGFIKIKIYDGSDFKDLARFSDSPLGRELSGPVPGGIFVDDNEIWIYMCSQREGIVYRYGNNFGLKNVLHAPVKGDVYVSDGVTYYPGIITKGRDNEMIISAGKLYYEETDGANTEYLDLSKYSTEGYWYSDLTDIGYERIQITGITIYFADEFTGGRTIQLSLKDRYNTYTISGLNPLGTVTTTNRIYRAKPINYTGGTPIPPLDGIGLNLYWGQGAGSSVTPIINKVVLDYKPVPIN